LERFYAFHELYRRFAEFGHCVLKSLLYFFISLYSFLFFVISYGPFKRKSFAHLFLREFSHFAGAHRLYYVLFLLPFLQFHSFTLALLLGLVFFPFPS